MSRLWMPLAIAAAFAMVTFVVLSGPSAHRTQQQASSAPLR